MVLFKKEAKPPQSISFIKTRNLRRNLTELKQVGTTDIKRDKARKALRAGKRVSKTGNIYWETRKNRSDAEGSKV